MPIFDYRCEGCGHVTSFLEKADARKAHVCEACGSKKTTRLYSTFAAKATDTTPSGPACPTGTCSLS